MSTLYPAASAGQNRAPDFSTAWTPPRMVATRPGSELPRPTLPPTPAPTPAPVPREPDDEPMVQRVVDAATAPRPATTAMSSPFVWPAPAAPAGVADLMELQGATDSHALDDSTSEPPPAPVAPPAAAAAPTEPPPPERPMPKRTTKKTTDAASPQFQLCAALLDGDKTRDELKACVSCTVAQLNSATFQAKKVDRIVFVAKTSKWHLTAHGREWVTGGANRKNQAAGKPRRTRDVPAPAAETKPAAAAPMPLATVQPITVVSEPSFRCAVFSDGGFHLAKSGQQIDLSAAECAQMVRYLERMAESAS
jgi:hypothetical protein